MRPQPPARQAASIRAPAAGVPSAPLTVPASTAPGWRKKSAVVAPADAFSPALPYPAAVTQTRWLPAATPSIRYLPSLAVVVQDVPASGSERRLGERVPPSSIAVTRAFDTG